MLTAIRDFINPYSEKIDEIVEPVITKIIEFLFKGYNVIYLAIAIVLLIVLISGLVTCFKKFPKFFFILIIILSLISVLWYFFVYK